MIYAVGLSVGVSGGTGSSVSQWRLMTRNYDKQLAALQRSPQIAREIEYVKENLRTVDSSKNLMDDQRLYRFTLQAFGLSDQVSARALNKKVLDSNLDDPRSFASRIRDKRYQEMAVFYDFFSLERRLAAPDARREVVLENYAKTLDGKVDKLVEMFAKQLFEEKAGEANQALRLGLYFRRKADEISNWFQVLADPALSEVVRGALGLPAETARANIDSQAAAFAAKFDIKKFDDPAEVNRFIERFMTRWDLTNRAAGGAQSFSGPGAAALAILSGGRPGFSGLSPASLAAAATFRRV